MATKKKSPAKKSAHAAKPAPAKKPLKAPVKHTPTKATAAAAPAPAPAPTAKKGGTASPLPAKAGSKAPMSAADLKRMLLERKSSPKTAIAFSLDEVREIALKNEKQAE